MKPYAHYAAKPMPCPVPLAAVLFPVVHPITVSGRFEIQDMGEVRSYSPRRKQSNTKRRVRRVYVQAVDPFERYREVLLTAPLVSAKAIADALGIRRETVNIYLGTKLELVEKVKHMNAKGHTVNYWKLK